MTSGTFPRVRASNAGMSATAHSESRRRLVLAAGASVLSSALGAHASTTVATPRQSLGPFYPYARELERDADLTTVRGGSGVAKGELTDLSGRVLDSNGRPLSGVRVELWQCNAFGRYHHPRDTRDAPLDPNFQGYGVTVTGADGAYRFRTIKPVPYPGRTPHIHFRLAGDDVPLLVTQMYVAGHPLNDDDFLLRSVIDPRAREALLVRFEPAAGSKLLTARFDITLANNGTLRSGSR